MPSSSKRIITCRCCGRRGQHAGYGWISGCIKRWRNAGRPPEGPPPPRDPTEEQRQERLARVEEYVFFTREYGLSREDAAGRLGICLRTAERYERTLREEGVAA